MVEGLSYKRAMAKKLRFLAVKPGKLYNFAAYDIKIYLL